MSSSGLAAGASGCAVTYGSPFSQLASIMGSSGSLPRNGTPNLLAMPAGPAPEGGKMSVTVYTHAVRETACEEPWEKREQPAVDGQSSKYLAAGTHKTAHVFNHAKDRQPRFHTEVNLLADVHHGDFLRRHTTRPCHNMTVMTADVTKRRLTCGVVTTIEPEIGVSFRYCTIEMCSSDVPGGAVQTQHARPSTSLSTTAHQQQTRAAGHTRTVNHEEVQHAPIHIHQELLDQACTQPHSG